MKQLLAPILVILAFSSIAQIGAKTQQNKLQGVWQNTSAGYQMTLILNADGTGEFDGQSIKYTTEGSTFSITVLDRAQTTMYKYTLLGNSFTVSGGDLQSPLTFVRTTSSNQSTQNNPVPSGMDKNLIGLWTGNGETIEFTASSQCKYMGQIYPYQLSNGFITLQTGQGNLMMGYSIQGAVLSLTVNGQTLQYTKSTGEAAQGLGQVTGGKKYIAQELVGKWCYVNVTNTNSGGSMSEQCITLNADGSYEYYGESSRSVNTNSYYSGTSSQNSDRGTWSYDDVRIYYTSSVNGGSGSYALEKRNHPKNNDPMIVLDGNTYVTFYQKAPWR